ncbi:hypothetical protein CLIB1423_09S01706 [[Candida] railenensis]|uniref:Uncharacterized protein n=1 Tax=[Candida] railenensis TaxID=45579 RepID=A0A9P0QR44_9ASCO|nr:hypothetical protein CLIB1423_09S01706 [[Candida] railenensis]
MLFRIGIHRLPHRRFIHSTKNLSALFGKSAPKITPPSGTSSSTINPIPNSTAAKIAAKIPRWLRPYTTDFANAPFSHLTAFIILHEISAIVPLIGLWYVFHQNHDYIPVDLPTWAVEKAMKVIDKGLATFDFSDYSVSDKAKFLMEGAYAYAITKALFPIRIIFSATFMPWFARWFVVPFTRVFSRSKSRKTKTEVPASSVDAELDPLKTKKVDKPRL